MKPRWSVVLPVFVAAVAVLACKRTPEERSQSSTVSAASAAPSPHAGTANAPNPHASAGASTASALKWADPPGWERANKTNPMRKATYRIPKEQGDAEDGELAVFYFGPGGGGSIDQNLKRWIGQFQDASEPKRSERTVAGMRQHLIEIEQGTFSSGMPGGPTEPKKDYAMLGAIVEAPNGNHFFKLTGPKKTVAAAKPKFMALLDSVATGS